MVKCLKRTGALTLALLLIGSAVKTGVQSTNGTADPEYTLADFVNNEVLAVYEDGSCEVLSYASQTELSEGLAELAAAEEITFVQPNYSYGKTGETVNDSMFSEQWELCNDGSFEIADDENDFPVFDDPFGQPFAPGQWTDPWFNRNSPFGGMMPGRNPFGGGMNSGWFGHSLSYKPTLVSSAVSGIDINMEEAWELYNGGSREVVVALIDTGVDASHEDFNTDVFWVNEGEIPGNGIDDDGNGYVDDVNGWNFYSNNNATYVGSEDNHGTHGAGSIAAATDNGMGIAGMVSDGSVKIMVLKALGGRDGSGTTEAVIKAIQYAEANGASICNLSIGTSQYDRALYQTMAASNMLFVVSAGNDSANSDRSASYPASFDLDNIISVANLQADGTLHSSSNYGSRSVDIAVPGTYILSLTTGNTYGYMTGTSMSAPILSGAAAMLYAYNDSLTLADVKNILLETAYPLDSLRGYVLTGGMLDVGAAMRYTAEND